jgi:DNA-binding NarL/FixJ family response regulator
VELGAAAAAWREAFRAAEDLPPHPDLLVNIGIAAMHLGDGVVVQKSYGALLTLARESGSVTSTVQALSRLPSGRIATGEWSTAAAAANEALVLARGTGQTPLTTMPLAWVGLLGALRGDAAATDALDELEAILAAQPVGIVGVAATDMAAWARGVLATNASDADRALHHLGRIRHSTIGRSAAFDRLEAAARAGRPDLVQTWADELEAFASAVDAPWAAAAAEHGRALISPGDAAAHHFDEALRLHATTSRPVSQARTQLAYGEFLRRNRQRLDARGHLTAALQVFGDLRAEPWAERARQELRASGATARKRDVAIVVELTPQERQTALLVSEGLANRDIAARLFLSPRTVEYHLSNVYQKLGIRSRGELAHLQLS